MSRFLATVRVLALTLLFFCLSGALRAQTAPSITTQPSSKTINQGTPTSFSVVATGTSLTYQWLFNGSNISGATASTYTLANPVPENAGTYACTVSSGGTTSVTSSNATLLIYVPYVLRTIAGTAYAMGSTNATGAAASFLSPQALVADSMGNIYVADTGNSIIRKITPSGVVTTVAGTPGVTGTTDGPGSVALFNYPCGIAIDPSGNLWVADTYNCTIRKITPQGIVSTFAGQAPSASIPSPINAGSTNATGTSAKFNFPRGIACDGMGNIYVADTLNDTVRKITPAAVVTTIAGSPNNTPQSLDGTGTAARFDYPYGIASDVNGNLWVADTSGQTIRSVTPTGVVTTLSGLAGNAGSNGGTGSVARFNQPASIAVDSSGNLYVADYVNSTIRLISPKGVVSTLVGLSGNTGAVDAAGSIARLYNPFGVAVDIGGNVYIADTLSQTIRIATPQTPDQFTPTIQTQPIGSTIIQSNSYTFTVVASGNPLPSYQWYLAGVPITGATTSTYTIKSAQLSDAGSYTVVVTNMIGSITSSAVTLNVTTIPVITMQPVATAAATGSTGTFTVASSTSGIGYQWYYNGTAISGATSATLSLPNVGTYQRGSYSVVVMNAAGSTTSNAAQLSVSSNARLLNLSSKGAVGTGSSALTAGVVIGGSNSKNLLLRGIGPTLSTFGISGALAKPQLTLYNSSSSILATNSSWGGSTTLSNLFNQVGAFGFAPASSDDALNQTLPAGAYTISVVGANSTTGIGMAEIYDADTTLTGSRLYNISTRANVGVGANALVAGFVIAGPSSETVLIRGVGPTLGNSPFNLTGVLARPSIIVQNASGTSLGTNSGWGGTPTLSQIFTSVGAFTLPTTSLDAALVITLAPGAYTATLTGVGSTTGIGILEIYEVQ
jgi:sugar lactone lactonase YvrE